MFDEHGDIRRPFAKGRNAQRVDVETVVEILSKSACRDFLLEVAVSRGDDARRHLNGPIAAEPRHLPVFQHAKQFGLCRKRQFSDFVEKQSPVTGRFECASAKAVCAGERAALVAEQFAFDKLFRQRRAVHRDQRRLRAGPQPVQFARHQFLARAAFTDDQDSAWNRRHTGDRRAERPHGRAVADKRRLAVES